jgi:hypothetical protein
MFSIASAFPPGSIGRQLAWIYLAGFAVITFAIGLSQPDIEGEDPVVKSAHSGTDDEERRSLLGSPED